MPAYFTRFPQHYMLAFLWRLSVCYVLQGTLHLGRLTGDGTGLIQIHSDHNVTISSRRTHINVHVQLNQGAALTIPDITYFEKITTIQGIVSRMDTLFIRSHIVLHTTGSISGETGAIAGHYWLTECTVLKGGSLQVVASSASDLSDGVHLHTELFDVEYGGKVSINGAFTIFAATVNIEKSAIVDGTATGYSASAGPGNGGSGQSGGSGAGYGGHGGRGDCCSGGKTYGDMYLPREKGSGGGNCLSYSGGSGGGAVMFAVSKLMTLEGWLKMDGANLGNCAGGGSGGAVWLDASFLEGWGKMNANGGTATRVCARTCHKYYSGYYCCEYRNGGGGGGGRIRAVTQRYGNKVVLHHHSITGGTGAAGHGNTGTWTVDTSDKCSGHGQWNITSCECDSGYVGDDCQYSCDAEVTCGGHGTCGEHGQCVCHVGQVGYHCEYVCHPVTNCNGHGHCSLWGTCVCDACFPGDHCSQECDGSGQCIADRCVCDNCHLGAFCESTCNGHGVCVDDGNNSSRCRCDATWRGDLCTRPGCPGDTKDCSGNGVCNAADNVCYCNPGWSGKTT